PQEASLEASATGRPSLRLNRVAMRLRRKSEGPAPVRRILVGTDRSETATRAVRWAAQMAERYDAELIVCPSVRDGMDKLTTQRDLAEYTEALVGPDARERRLAGGACAPAARRARGARPDLREARTDPLDPARPGAAGVHRRALVPAGRCSAADRGRGRAGDGRGARRSVGGRLRVDRA